MRELYNSVLIPTRLAHQGALDDVYCNVTIFKITQVYTYGVFLLQKIFVLPHKKPVSNELCRILEFTVYRNQVENLTIEDALDFNLGVNGYALFLSLQQNSDS
jgi:hypothetical protein